MRFYMSDFSVPVVEIDIVEHPDADSLEIAKIKGMDYVTIVKKGEYSSGQLVVYIPEDSIVPQYIIDDLGLDKKLAGSKKNRVKAIKLRGVVSQGLIYKNKFNDKIGEDVAEKYGIEKYVVAVPEHLGGEVCNIGREYTLKFDINNIKSNPTLFTNSDEIEVTEKIHGTFVMAGAFPSNGYSHEEIIKNKVFVSSKKLSADGLVFKDNEKNINNAYIKAIKENNLDKILMELADKYDSEIIFMGEVFGKGIQDLAYTKSNELNFRLFDILIIKDNTRYYFSREEVSNICLNYNIKMATILYSGVFDRDVIDNLTNGKETISGYSLHIREGVVIRNKNKHLEKFRKILKSVSFDYLNRKGGTEYN